MKSAFWIGLGGTALGLALAACGSDDSAPTPVATTGGAAGASGAAGSAGTAGMAGASGQGGAAGAAGEAGAAGAAGEAGSAGSAGSAGATGCPGGTGPKASHTECMGTNGIGHLPGKEEAKTNCSSCHLADLGKATSSSCWKCHDPAATHTLMKGGVAHKPGASSTNSKDPKCVTCHAASGQGLATCTPCHQ